MMCKLKGRIDKGGHYDVEMKGWIQKGGHYDSVQSKSDGWTREGITMWTTSKGGCNKWRDIMMCRLKGMDG